MAAARYSSDVLQLFYRSTKEKEKSENKKQPQSLQPEIIERYNRFLLAQNNFQDWLRVWKIVVPEEYNSDLLGFERRTKSKFINLVKYRIRCK